MRDAAIAELLHERFRQSQRKGQVVLRVHEERPLVAETFQVGLRADRRPDAAQRVHADVAVEALAHVACRQTLPDDIGEVRRDVVEGRRADTWLVRGRQQEPRAGRTDRTNRTDRSNGTLRTNCSIGSIAASRTLRSSCTGRTDRALRTYDAQRSSRTDRTSRSLCAVVAGRTLRSDRTNGTL